MKRFVLFVAFASVAQLAIAQEPVKDTKVAEWTVVGLRVQKPDARLQSLYGTSVDCVLHLPERFIVGLEIGKCKVKVTDNQNTDLHDSTILSDLASDRKSTRVIFRAAAPPAKKTSHIHIKGSVVVLLGKHEKEIEIKDVMLARPIKLAIGTVQMSEAIPPSDRGNLFYNGSRPLKTMMARTADGEEVAFRLIPSSKEDPNKADFYTGFSPTGYKKLPADPCTLRVIYFDTVERVVVPINLEVGLGF